MLRCGDCVGVRVVEGAECHSHHGVAAAESVDVGLLGSSESHGVLAFLE